MFPDQTSVWLPFDETEAEPEPEALQVDRAERNLQHIFVSKTVKMLQVIQFDIRIHLTAHFPLDVLVLCV